MGITYLKPIKVSFKDLGSYGSKYSNLEALGWMRDGTLYIYINMKHKGENPSVLAPLVAGRTAHQDRHISISEQVYATVIEAVV